MNKKLDENILKKCPEGKILNPKTNRCIKNKNNKKYENKVKINKYIKNDKIIKNNINKNMNIAIINNLKIIEQYEKVLGNTFKANSYIKAIKLIELYPNNINTILELNNLKGVGNNIKKKIEEYIITGKITKIEEIQNDEKYNLRDKLSKIYGIGPSKIEELLKKINSLNELYLVENKDLLNKKQQIGLKYINDLEERIPYEEGEKHYNIIKKHIDDFSNNIEFDMVGSYRRKKSDLGDIDILIKNENNFNLKDFIKKLNEDKYIIENLANGQKKFMGICKLDEKSVGRRIDILLCDKKHYYFTLLYFTGSYQFNIKMRRKALEQGYSLSEYGLTEVNTKNLKEFNINSEKDIFKIIKMDYVKPEDR
jgi:DNA polymerase/3'-5' exonuclease PolX